MAIYVDDLLKHLESCKFGCYIGHRCVNSFMYADDPVIRVIFNWRTAAVILYIIWQYTSNKINLKISILCCQPSCMLWADLHFVYTILLV